MARKLSSYLRPGQYAAFGQRGEEILPPVITNLPSRVKSPALLDSSPNELSRAGTRVSSLSDIDRRAMFKGAATGGTLMSPAARVAAGVIRGPRDAQGNQIQRAPTQGQPLSGIAPSGPGRTLSRSTRDIDTERTRFAGVAQSVLKKQQAARFRAQQKQELDLANIEAGGKILSARETAQGKRDVAKLKAEVDREGIEATNARLQDTIKADRDNKLLALQNATDISDADRALEAAKINSEAMSNRVASMVKLAEVANTANAVEIKELGGLHKNYSNALTYLSDITDPEIANARTALQGKLQGIESDMGLVADELDVTDGIDIGGVAPVEAPQVGEIDAGQAAGPMDFDRSGDVSPEERERSISQADGIMSDFEAMSQADKLKFKNNPKVVWAQEVRRLVQSEIKQQAQQAIGGTQ